MRFHPPPLRRTAELDWVLVRAFGDGRSCAPPEGVDLDAAAGLARRLGLAARVGSRARPQDSGGHPALAGLLRETRLAAASALRSSHAARRLAELAAAQGIPCCFLKGVALEALGLTPAGSRALADVDVLVRAEEATALGHAMREEGFASAGEGHPHQLPAFAHSVYGIVELHLHLPGVSPGGEPRFATFANVGAARLMEPWTGMPEGTFLPSRQLLAAHLLAHALGQHGFRPDGYPLARVIGDLVDLGAAGEAGDELLAGSVGLLSPLVPASEARAAFAVARALAHGETTLVEAETPAGMLLRHLLSAALDDSYRVSLKLQDLAYPLREGGQLRRRVAAARHALVLSQGQVDAIYGRPRHRWGYAARRLLRPLHLAWRAGRALLS